MLKQIDNEILNILDGAKVEGHLVTLNCRQLDRKTYVEVNKVLEALGGKWNRKAKGHIFDNDPAVDLEAAILTGGYTNRKDDFGFFETPYPLAKRLCEMADIFVDMRVLEPSAGRGAILDVLTDHVAKNRIYAVEVLPMNATYLQEKGFYAMLGDFLSLKPDEDLPLADRIVMNPPFAKQADIDHVRHAFTFLEPGGRLVSVMSAGVKFRENRKTLEFREFVDGHGIMLDNPPDAFKSSGTAVNTVTVALDRLIDLAT